MRRFLERACEMGQASVSDTCDEDPNLSAEYMLKTGQSAAVRWRACHWERRARPPAPPSPSYSLRMVQVLARSVVRAGCARTCRER